MATSRSGIDVDILVRDRRLRFIIRDGLWPKTNEYHAGMANVIAALGDEDVTSAEELFLKWEACDIVSRLRPDAEPPVIFKGATIYAKQLRQARAARAIRLGRVSEITKDEIVLKQGREPLPSNALVVDCTAGKAEPGAFFGYAAGDDFEFFGEGSITLGPLLQMLNPSATSAIVAYLEATFEDDATKNAFCYLPRGKYAAGDGKDGRATGPTAFLAQMYAAAALKSRHVVSSASQVRRRESGHGAPDLLARPEVLLGVAYERRRADAPRRRLPVALVRVRAAAPRLEKQALRQARRRGRVHGCGRRLLRHGPPRREARQDLRQDVRQNGEEEERLAAQAAGPRGVTPLTTVSPSQDHAPPLSRSPSPFARG